MAGELDRVKEDVRRRADIVELVGKRVSLKRAGRSFKGLCPFHDDKTPSFTVNPEFGSYRCWSCGAKGDVFTWVMETQRVDFFEALKILAKEAGIELPKLGDKRGEDSLDYEAAMIEALAFFKEELTKSPMAREYLLQRDLDEETVLNWELGYGPDIGEALAMRLKKKGFSLPECKSLFLVDQDSTGGYYDRFRSRLMFPIRDERGKLVAFGGRIIGSGIPKYINSSDTPLYSKSRVLYGMHKAKEAMASGKRAVLVEGYLDVIACHRAGVKDAVASLGTALADEQVRLLKRWCERVVVLYDSDAAGQKAADRAAELLTAQGIQVKIALMPDGEDPDTLLRAQGPGAVQKATERGISPMEFRIGQLKAKFDPASEEYWREVPRILATAESPLELQKYLLPIAAEYPGIRDRNAATKALERMVQAERKRAAAEKAGRTWHEDAPSPHAASQNEELLKQLIGPERVILRALFDPLLSSAAWKACGMPHLFATEAGARMAACALLVLEGPPSGNPSAWIFEIKDEDVAMAFTDLGMGEDNEPVTEETLEEAKERLSRAADHREAREIAASADSSSDAALRDLNDRLRKLKGDQ